MRTCVGFDIDKKYKWTLLSYFNILLFCYLFLQQENVYIDQYVFRFRVRKQESPNLNTPKIDDSPYVWLERFLFQ